jgi:hypothetical protein
MSRVVVSSLSGLMASARKHATIMISTALLLASLAFLYRDIVGKLVRDWATDDNYSHGFLILPLAIYFTWERRNRLAKAVQVHPYFSFGDFKRCHLVTLRMAVP